MGRSANILVNIPSKVYVWETPPNHRESQLDNFGVRQQLDTLDFLLFLTTTVMFVKGKYFDPRDTFTSHELHVYTLK